MILPFQDPVPAVSVVAAAVVTGIGVVGSIVSAVVRRAGETGLVAKLLDELPGLDCGVCGYETCEDYARALVSGSEGSIIRCFPGRQKTADKVAARLERPRTHWPDNVARIKCGADREECPDRFQYQGIRDCRAAFLLSGGPRGCQEGCLGFGSCVAACPFGAIKPGPGAHTSSVRQAGAIPMIDEELCNGCGLCLSPCPTSVIELMPRTQRTYVRCNTTAPGSAVHTFCSVGCIGCGLCHKVCPTFAIPQETGLAVINARACTNCGICAPKCPTDSIATLAVEKRYADIKPDLCNGCGKCGPVCPVEAIVGKYPDIHKVKADACIGCGLCLPVCPTAAIVSRILE